MAEKKGKIEYVLTNVKKTNMKSPFLLPPFCDEIFLRGGLVLICCINVFFYPSLAEKKSVADGPTYRVEAPN